MRLSDYRHHEPKPGLTRQVMLGSLFLYLTGCTLTGINNQLSNTELLWNADEQALQPAGEPKGAPAQGPVH
jgi:outer membrane biogenesis lipoprotein LolB